MKKTLALLGALTVLAAAPVFAHDADMMFNKMDTNHDGMISADEHAAFAEKMFKEADTNGDGMLSKDEVKAYHAKQQAAWASKTHHGIGHKGSAADDNHPAQSDANPHPTKDKQDQDM